MAEMFYDDDADLSMIQGKKVAVIGYGSQGHAHALNLRDSGVDVRVGLPEGSKSRAKAEAEGLRVADAGRGRRGGRRDRHPRARPGPAAASTPRRSSPTSRPGDALFFGHGFNIRFGYIKPPDGVDVIMVAPKGPGHLVRREYVDGRGVPVLVAVEQDATGKAWDLALSYAKAHRRPARRRHQDDLHRGDRDRPVRRAGRAVRRRLAAGAVRLRDADRGRLPARGRLLRVPARAQADRRPDVRGRHRQAALVGLRHRRVRRLRLRPARHRRARQGEHAGRPRRHQERHLRRSASSTTRTPAPRSSRSCAPRASSTRSRPPAASCAS